MSDGQAFAGGCPRDWVPVTKSDSVNEAFTMRGLYIPTNGNLKVTTLAGNNREFANLQAGSILPGFFSRVWVNGTTITGTILGGDDRVIAA